MTTLVVPLVPIPSGVASVEPSIPLVTLKGLPVPMNVSVVASEFPLGGSGAPILSKLPPAPVQLTSALSHFPLVPSQLGVPRGAPFHPRWGDGGASVLLCAEGAGEAGDEGSKEEGS